MADITKCDGGECPKKEECYRYTVESSQWQAFFTHLPYTKESGCEMFTPNKEYNESK